MHYRTGSPSTCLAFTGPESSDAQFWPDLYASETTPGEWISNVETLLDSASKIATARNFQGSEATTFVEFLDRVSGSNTQVDVSKS